MTAAARNLTRTRLWVAAILVALVATTTPLDSRALTSVVVVARDGLDAAAAAVAQIGGHVTQPVPTFGVLLADIPPGTESELEADPRTVAVSPDLPLGVQSDGFADGPSAALETIAAPRAWKDGHTGAGVGVAVVDTGISPHPEIESRIVAAFDVSGEGTPTDGYGHGTFMAGLVAGRRTGAAPDAHLVSVKVAGADGETSLGRVLAGLAVVDTLRDELDVDVVLLALSGPAHEGTDPLQIALEQLWARGLTVVVAAGNDGGAPGSVGTPGADPYVITVGAIDDAGTPKSKDDSVPSWSAVGPTLDGVVKPEVVAPGTSVVSLRAPGSSIDFEHADARVGEHHFRGSGTSMAAAFTAGAAANLLDAHPGLAPDEVKGRLMAGAAKAPKGAAAGAVGNGVVDIVSSIDVKPASANGDLGAIPTLDDRTDEFGIRGRGRDDVDRPDAGREAIEVTGWRWSDGTWTGWRWSGWRWSGWRWSGWRWSGWRWSGWRWSGWRWSGWRWTATGWA